MSLFFSASSCSFLVLSITSLATADNGTLNVPPLIVLHAHLVFTDPPHKMAINCQPHIPSPSTFTSSVASRPFSIFSFFFLVHFCIFQHEDRGNSYYAFPAFLWVLGHSVDRSVLACSQLGLPWRKLSRRSIAFGRWSKGGYGGCRWVFEPLIQSGPQLLTCPLRFLLKVK